MKSVGLFLLFILTTSASHASIIENQQYLLEDHPDSALSADGPYGLRLDSFANEGSGGDWGNASKTFSTQQNSASAMLIWNGNTASITGTLSRNSNGSIWNVIYNLYEVSAVAGGFQATVGAGMLTSATNPMEFFILAGKANDAGIVFSALGDGHRLDNNYGQVARGWLQGDNTNDWLVKLTPVPVPAALPLLISGLLGFSFFSRKKA